MEPGDPSVQLLHSLFSLKGFSVDKLELWGSCNLNMGDITPKYRNIYTGICGIEMSWRKGGDQKKEVEKY